MKGKPEPISRRFWRFVLLGGPCWLWTGCLARGRARVRVNGKTHNAARVAYELCFGPIPAGQQVLHRCDDPACVRPSHLFLGTQRDNMEDMIRKGRYRGCAKM